MMALDPVDFAKSLLEVPATPMILTPRHVLEGLVAQIEHFKQIAGCIDLPLTDASQIMKDSSSLP